MSDITLGGQPYVLSSYEVDLARKQAVVRFAPVVEGVADIHGAIEHETIRNEPDPPKPPDLPAKPEPPPTDAPDEAHEAHGAEMRDWLALRRLHATENAKYQAAVRQSRGWDEWVADGRPETLKAVEHFKKRRGMS